MSFRFVLLFVVFLRTSAEKLFNFSPQFSFFSVNHKLVISQKNYTCMRDVDRNELIFKSESADGSQTSLTADPLLFLNDFSTEMKGVSLINPIEAIKPDYTENK